MDPIGERKPDPIKVELNPFKLYTGSFRDLKKGIDQRIQQGITRGLFDRNDFGKIQNLLGLKTENVEPLTSIAETTLKLRSDEVKSKNIREQIIKNSPQDNEDYFVVPKVIE